MRNLAHRTQIQVVPADLRDGIGVIFLNGEPVFFDIRATRITSGDRFVVVTKAGDVKVDTPRSVHPATRDMGPRGAMASPQMEAVPGRRDPIPVEWECVILGRVIERKDVVRPPQVEHVPQPRWPSHPHVWERVLPDGASPMIDTLKKSEKLPDGSIALPIVGGGYSILPPQHARRA